MARSLLLGTALQTGLTFTAAMASLPAAAQPAPNARPTGGSVVAGAAAISQTASNTRDQPVLPARRHRLEELQRRQPAERHLQPAFGQRGRAEPRHRPRPVADRRPHRRQRPDHPGEPVGRELLQGRPGQRRRPDGLRRGHQQPELHGRRHEVRPAGQSERRASTTRATSPSSRPASPRWWRRRWPIPAPSPRGWAMSCWRVRRPRRSICMVTGCCRSM